MWGKKDKYSGAEVLLVTAVGSVVHERCVQSENVFLVFVLNENVLRLLLFCDDLRRHICNYAFVPTMLIEMNRQLLTHTNVRYRG